MNSNQISKAVRLALVAGAVSAVAAPAAFAADATATTDQSTTANQNSTAQLGKIEVTGTRIKRTDVETAQPVTIITAAQLKQTGLTSIGDILQTVSQSGGGLNTTFNNGGNGSTNIDLRFLGANRVLVLVNGRRWIPALNGTVDLNTIPVSVIDHVEILQDGASAIYGSDAISGVINIITTKTYNGAEASAYQSVYNGEGHHDGKVQAYDFTIGSSGDKSSVVMNVGYVNQHEVWAGARSISQEPIRGEGPASGSSASPNGRFILFPGNWSGTGGGSCAGSGTINENKSANGTPYGSCDMTLKAGGKGGVVGAATGPSLGNFRNWQGADHYNFAPLNYFVTPNERTSMYVQGQYDLADNLTFTSDGLFNRRTSQQALASSPLFLGFAGTSDVNGVPIGIGKSNPYNPFGEDLVGSPSQWCIGGNTPMDPNLFGSMQTPSTCTGGTNGLLEFLGRRPIEAGQRLFDENVETFQYSGGLKGYFNLGGNEWDWDTNYVYGDNYESDLTTGLFNTQNLAEALDDPGVASCASLAKCVPFNIFGGAGSITPAMLDWVLFEAHDVTEETMRDYTGNINGSLADLPAGPLGFAAGYEYLEFDGYSHPDATTSSGNTSGNVTQPTNGRTKTSAEYAEFDFPLVADAPGFKMLDLDIANRWSQFKWFGGIPGSTASTIVHTANASTGRAALKWQPSDELLVRASWSQGFRAPSINDLFLGNSDSFPSASDPCANITPLPAGCKGVHHTQPNQQIKSTVGGNPSLSPEKSLSRSIGFVYNPDWFAGFDFSLDYYKIDLEQEVTAVTPQQILNGCYLGQNANDCAKISLAGNIITDILDTNVNIGGVKTSGVDLATHYKFPSTSMGDFKLGLDMTFLKTYVQTNPATCTAVDLNGAGVGSQMGCSSTADIGHPYFTHTDLGGSTTSFGGFPRRKGDVSLNWNYGDWSANWMASYIGSMYELCSGAMIADGICSNVAPAHVPGGGPAGVSRNYLGTTIYHDVQASYHVDSLNTDFSFGIRNLFDKEPPTADSAFANSFLPSFYRVPGREYYGRISVKF